MSTKNLGSSGLISSLKKRSTSLSIQTPTFNNDAQSSLINYDNVSSINKRVSLTPKLTDSTKKNKKNEQVKIMMPSEPQVTKIYLYNSSKTQMYCFPVFRESDLKYRPPTQILWRDADVDNGCETDNDVLENSIYHCKEDLVKGIQMQRDKGL